MPHASLAAESAIGDIASMNRLPFLLLIPLLFFLGVSQNTHADEPTDQIIAVIERSIILASEIDFYAVEEAILNPDFRGIPRETLRQRHLSNAIYDRVLFFWAMTVIEEPPPEFIEARTRSAFERFRLAAGGERQLQALLRDEGVDQQRFRNWVRDQARMSFVIREAILAFTDLGDATPDPGEIADAERILIAHLLIQPRGGTEPAIAAARDRILSLRRDIERGLSFRDAAMLYSEDHFSAPRGGELGWFRPGELDPILWKAATQTRPGATSEVVRTRSGFHLVLVLNYETEANRRYFQLVRQAEERRLRELLDVSDIRVAEGFFLEPLEALPPSETGVDRWELFDDGMDEDDGA